MARVLSVVTILLATPILLPGGESNAVPKPMRIVIIGDSTVQSYPKPPADRPTLTGWVELLPVHGQVIHSDQILIGADVGEQRELGDDLARARGRGMEIVECF